MPKELDLARRVAALSPAKRALLERRLQVNGKSSNPARAGERNRIPGLISFDKATDLPPIFWAPSVGDLERFAECSYLAQLLRDDRSFCTFEPAPEFGEIRTLAGHCVKLMRAKQPRGPYAIVGYCHCGHIAYEMACQLQTQGEETSMLVIMDGSAHDFSLNLWQRCYWLRDSFRAKWKSIGPILFSKLSKRIAGLIDPRNAARKKDDSRWGIHTLAANRYKPGLFKGKIILFRSPEILGSSRSPLFGWDAIAREVEPYTVPFPHWRMTIEGGAEFIAQKLKPLLAEPAQAEARRKA